MKTYRILLDPDTAGGSGGPATESVAPAAPSGGSEQGRPAISETIKTLWGGESANTDGASLPVGAEGVAALPPTPASPQVPAVVTQAPASFTPEQLERVMTTAATAAVRANQPQQQEQQLTVEQFKKQFNIYEPSEEDLAGLFVADPKQARANLSKMLQAVATQAVTIASAQTEYMLDQQRQQFQPAMSMAQQAAERRLEDEFMDQNKDLKGYEPLLKQLKDSLIAQGVKGLSKEQAFRTIAERAREMIKSLPNSGGQQTASGGGPTRTQTPTPPKMPALSGGSQGGTGDSNRSSQGSPGGNGKIHSTAKAIFG